MAPLLQTLLRPGACVLAGVFAAASLTLESAHAQAPVRIHIIGDSITESYAGRPSLRYHLDQHLTNANYAFDFVGHNSGVFGGAPLYPNFDQDHECYSGWQINHMLLDIDVWAQESQPDIAIIHLGTNDVIRNQPAAANIAEMELLIDILRGANPNVTVLVAQIIPIVGRAVEPFNALLPGMCAAKDTPTSRVVAVDHYTPFDPALHMLGDGLHPNNLGEQVMAQVWFDALRDFMTPTPQSFAVIGNGCSGTLAVAPDVEAIRGQAASLNNPFTVRFEGAPVGATAFGILGFDPNAYYGVPLPIDLSILGAPGCMMRVGPDLTMPIPIVGNEAMWTLVIPDNPLLVGGSFYQQAAFIAPGENALGLLFSAASHVTVVQGS